jgi:tetraacyldisaccharide 4'-kinase
MVMWLAERFLEEGKSVGILTRGYKGSNGTSDEVEVMKRRLGDRVRFGVGADRYSQGRKIEAAKQVDIFLLDDGFQHLKLARDVDIVLVDASWDWTTEKLLPAGFLREPLSAVERADLVVATRVAEIEGDVKIGGRQAFPVKTIASEARLLNGGEASEISDLRGRGPLFAFCGIGNPAGFFRDLDVARLRIAGTKAFADHHKYSASDIESVEKEAKRLGANGLITTEKDEANLAGLPFRMPVWVAVTRLAVGDEGAMMEKIRCVLREKRGATA